MAALPVATGAIATVGGSTVLRGYASALAAGDHEMVALSAGRQISVTGGSMLATNADNTLQWFSGDPGAGGTAVSEIMNPSVQVDSMMPPGVHVFAQTLSGEALWAQVGGTGTVSLHFFHASTEA